MSNTREIIKEIVKEEIGKLFGETPSISLDDIPEIADDELVECELTEAMMAGSGGFKKRLRKKAGKLVVIKKRKKKPHSTIAQEIEAMKLIGQCYQTFDVCELADMKVI